MGNGGCSVRTTHCHGGSPGDFAPVVLSPYSAWPEKMAEEGWKLSSGMSFGATGWRIKTLIRAEDADSWDMLMEKLKKALAVGDSVGDKNSAVVRVIWGKKLLRLWRFSFLCCVTHHLCMCSAAEQTDLWQATNPDPTIASNRYVEWPMMAFPLAAG